MTVSEGVSPLPRLGELARPPLNPPLTNTLATVNFFNPLTTTVTIVVSLQQGGALPQRRVRV